MYSKAIVASARCSDTLLRMTKRTEQVNVRLDPEMKAELTAFADAQHRSLSNLILAVLKDWLAAQREIGKKT